MPSTPPTAQSPSDSPATRSSPHSPLSLDLSNLPPLSTPAAPSNTLLITNLDSLAIFHPAALATIRQYISNLVPEELHSFSPLRSLRRIVCSFYSIDAAKKVRQELDRTTLLGANSPVLQDETQEIPDTASAHDVRTKIYFGEPTPIDNKKHYLNKPDAGKLFFISPPPSPPVGWETKLEDAPNAETHASDLQIALEKLGSKIRDGGNFSGDIKEDRVNDLEAKINNAVVSGETAEPTSANTRSGTRTRSGSTTVIYDPESHATGREKKLPSVIIEDTTHVENEDEVDGPRLDDGKKIAAHTPRPPVELME